MELKGPREDKMIHLVSETLNGLIEVELRNIKSNKVIFKDTTHCAGVEYGGDQKLVLDSE